ncbi:MAG: hypothetical protein RLZZ455_353 [Candidatus Parcubacteria bacterium]|jgi:hypothetical protein
MKQPTTLLLLFLSLFILFPQTSHAHILEKSGTIGGVIHIDPDDDPIVGQESSIMIELKDTESLLTKDNCTCSFEIISEGKTLYEQPLFQGIENSDQSIAIPYTFPRRDIYLLRIKGQALDKEFNPFTLEYSIRVSREQSEKKSLTSSVSFLSTHLPHTIGVGIIILFIAGALLRKRLAQ